MKFMVVMMIILIMMMIIIILFNFMSFLLTNKIVVTKYITSKSRYVSLNSRETVANHT